MNAPHTGAELNKLYDQADRLKDQGKSDEAIALLNQILGEDPQYMLAHMALSRIALSRQNFEQAVKHAADACNAAPNDGLAFTNLSIMFQRAGKIFEAEEAMARARMLQAQQMQK